MYFEEEIKLEDCFSSNSTLCFACLSSTRKLSSLGEYCDIFGKFFDYECSPDLRPISLCWECTAVLRKVKLFKEKVVHAQTLLSYHCLTQDTPPSCLSSLITTEVEISSLRVGCDEVSHLTKDPKEGCTENEDKLNGDIEVEIKEEHCNEDTDDMVALGWEEDSISTDVNEINDSQSNFTSVKKVDVDNNEKIPKDIARKANIKGKKCNKLKTTKTFKKTVIKNEETKEIKSESAVITRSLTTADKLICKEASICAKRPRQTAISALKKLKTKIKTDKDIVLKDSCKRQDKVDPDYKDNVRIEKSNKIVKHLPYTFFKTGVKVTINKVPVALDEVRMWMDKDRETEVFKNLKYKCELCVKSIGSTKLMVAHKSDHRELPHRKLVCNICGLRRFFVETEKRLQNHIKHHHTSLLQCSVCEFKCYLPELMDNHIRIHTKNLQCKTCNGVFLTCVDFYKHYFVCDDCGLCFKKIELLIKHIRSHISYDCLVCNKKLKNSIRYKRHMLTTNHKKNYKEQNPPAPSYCVQCDMNFETDFAFRTHIRQSKVHENEIATEFKPPNPKTNVNKAKSKTLPCPVCLKTFASRTSVNNHYLFVHKQEYRHKCRSCNKVYIDRGKLNLHNARVHRGIKPVKDKFCPHCPRAFQNNAILRHHIRTHTGERPYQCEHCDARFVQRVAWTQHVKFVHLKEKREKLNINEPSQGQDSEIN